ncbi:MAG: MFS transporter [Acidobacteria bacterium]|nr:MFS transporter [Acidobacteriota bacterium]MBV9187859.1 MFS transporter [Acidobacteriota bacterium]
MFPLDARLLFAARIVRLFAYGFVAVVLVLYLSAIGLDDHRIGLLLSLTLAGDVIVSLFLTTRADALGRKRTLLAGALLMIGAAVVFAITRDFALLVLAATIGVISPSGNEVGPFLAVEQVALAQAAQGRDRTSLFAWYNLAGSFATAAGSLAGGFLSGLLMSRGFGAVASYRSAIIAYAILGGTLAIVFAGLSSAIEGQRTAKPVRSLFRVEQSRSIVMKLSGLFAIDSFAGGLVVQSIVAYWFFRRFGLSPAALGSLFFGANLAAGVSALLAARIAKRFGLLNTMVFTHLPSNILLILVPLMPTLPLAIAVLLLRFSISQMDVPTRQAFVLAAVDPSERTAAAGITGVARTTGAALAPVIAMPLIASLTHSWLPFIAAGGLKIVYDLALLRSCRGVKLEG